MKNAADYYAHEKSAATRAKHELLLRYQKIWQGIVLNALRDQSGSLVYLDTCAGTGLFPAKEGEFLEKAGSPLIGLFNLSEVKKDTRFITDNKRFFAMLFEKETALYEALVRNLNMAGFPKEMYHVENADYQEKLDSILDCIKDSYTFTLAFIDPFSIAPLPFNVVQRILRTGRTDALIFFPAMQIRRYQGHIWGNDFPGKNTFLSQMSDFFGTDSWGDVISNARDGDDAVDKLERFYIEKLSSLGKYSISVDFLYERQENVLFKIILVTASTVAALQAKKVFCQIEAYQAYLRSSKFGQTLLFNEKEQIYESVDTDIADSLVSHFKGKTVKGKDLYNWALRNPGVFKENLSRAVTLLQKQGRIVNPERSKWNVRSTVSFL